MAKGRRERDRPKAAPGSLYNPHKRVRLSYDSESDDETAEQQRPVTGNEGVNANDGEREVEVNDKEKVSRAEEDGNAIQDDAPAVANTEKASGEQRDGDEQDGAAGSSYTRLRNPHTGQRHALGAVSWQQEGSDEEEDGSTDSAMEYLRAVRSERQTMPIVLSGSHLHPQGEFYTDDFEFYDDHAVIAAPDKPVQREHHSSDPREAFTAALKQRFLAQRDLLHQLPTPEAVAALDDKHPISYPPMLNKAKAEWLEILASIPPAAAQVRSLDQDSVFRLLELIQERYLVRQKDIESVTSAWIWSLLARLIEVGLMDNDQVSTVRAFGKKTVLVQVSFRSSETAAQLEGLANGEDGPSMVQSEEGVNDSAEVEVDEAHSQSQPTKLVSANETADRENTLATLDTILVIVGDIYGQRDLLEFRQPWEVDEGITPDG